MEQWIRDALAEEMGYIICPLTAETYTICNEKCEECELQKENEKQFRRCFK